MWGRKTLKINWPSTAGYCILVYERTVDCSEMYVTKNIRDNPCSGNDSAFFLRNKMTPLFFRPIRKPHILKIRVSISWRQPRYRCMEILRCMKILRCLSKNGLYTKMLRIHCFSISTITTPRAVTCISKGSQQKTPCTKAAKATMLRCHLSNNY